jgi:hypothetical protein
MGSDRAPTPPAKQWEHHGLKSWIEAAKKRHNVLAIALANKLARIRAILRKGRCFECVKTDAMAPRPL